MGQRVSLWGRDGEFPVCTRKEGQRHAFSWWQACLFCHFLLWILQLRQPCGTRDGKTMEEMEKQSRAPAPTLETPTCQLFPLWSNETPKGWNQMSPGFYSLWLNTSCFKEEIFTCAENMTLSLICCSLRIWWLNFPLLGHAPFLSPPAPLPSLGINFLWKFPG